MDAQQLIANVEFGDTEPSAATYRGGFAGSVEEGSHRRRSMAGDETSQCGGNDLWRLDKATTMTTAIMGRALQGRNYQIWGFPNFSV